MSISSRIKAFAGTVPGYAILLALISLTVAASVIYLGTIFGAISLLIFAFGVPIYLGWGKTLRHFLLVALVVCLVTPPIATAFLSNELVTPSPAYVSPDGVLQQAVVSPFQSTSATFNFSVEVQPSKLPKDYRLTQIFLWVTNCPTDTNSSRGSCGSAHETFLNLTTPVTPTQQNVTGTFPVSFQQSLPGGQIFYFEFFTWGVNTTSTAALSSSCTGPPGQGICGFAEGPVTGTYGTIYGLVILELYVLMAELAIVLIVAILFYRFIKMREKRRNDMAKEAAGGEPTKTETTESSSADSSAPLASGGSSAPASKPSSKAAGTRCPQCGASVKAGEEFCWKCGHKLD